MRRLGCPNKEENWGGGGGGGSPCKPKCLNKEIEYFCPALDHRPHIGKKGISNSI